VSHQHRDLRERGGIADGWRQACRARLLAAETRNSWRLIAGLHHDEDADGRCSLLTSPASPVFATNEPEHVVDLLREAIPTVSTSKSVQLMGKVRTARTALQSWNGERYVRELDDQLMAAGLA
jgi:hypothetical protein